MEYKIYFLMYDGEGKQFRIAPDHAIVDGNRMTVEEARKLWASMKKNGWMEP